MHQTFYIDIDEEITSIVEKLKKARAKEIIMVVPKRALLIQSIVNLRILKKEADEAGLQLMIVTQDKLGKILIEKAGILVQQKMDNIADEEIDFDEPDSMPATTPLPARVEYSENVETKSRLERIGSSEYFNEATIIPPEELKKEFSRVKQAAEIQGDSEGREKILNKELVTGVSGVASKRTALDMGPRTITPPPVAYSPAPVRSIQPTYSSVPARRTPEVPLASQAGSLPRAAYSNDRSSGGGYATRDDSERQGKIENFFQSQNNLYLKQREIPKDDFFSKQKDRPEDLNRDYHVPGHAHKWFWSFGIVVVLAVLVVAAYLFIPKVKVVITAKAQTKTIDSNLLAETSVSSSDYENWIIPAKLITADVQVPQNFTPTGRKILTSQKAHGVITIYNDYSSQPQPLVATTRFLSSGGKLFRLVNAVTVPGATQSGGQLQPGNIEAEVEADQSGTDYNIGPDTFNLPGLKGSPKYSKIYAKSSGSMDGGGAGNVEANMVTAQDVSTAEQTLASSLDNAVKQKIKELAGGNTLIPDGAISEGQASYLLSNSVGEGANSPQVTASLQAQALVVDQSTFDDMVGRKLTQSNTSGQPVINPDTLSVINIKAVPNFKTGTLTISFHASANLENNINVAQIQGQILGKSESQLKAYLSNYPAITKIEVDYWPSFISGRIPFWSKRVDVTLDNN